MNPEFVPFPKIPRLTGGMIITEKIDGTNAAIGIREKEDGSGEFNFWAQSRTRIITPQDDNYGFAKWAYDNVAELVKLGPGIHFGEWWGQGIRRGYGLDEKRFSLFNAGRWTPLDYDGIIQGYRCAEVPVCHVVPVLYQGPFDTLEAKRVENDLRNMGSRAAEGFMNPEGIVIFDTAGRNYYKLNDAKQGEKHAVREQG